MKRKNARNNVENNIHSILLDDGHFLFKLKKKSTTSTRSYFDTINTKGITLIALIITIIIMLILSGVVISLTIGEKGLFNTAKYAVKKWNNEAEKEQKELAKLDSLLYYTSFEDMLRECEIDTKYTLEDLVSNKDGILKKVLSNNNAVNYILANPNDYLDAFACSETAIVMLVTNENSREKIADNELWLDKLIERGKEIAEFNQNMQVIPNMTSNTEPSGTVTESIEHDSRYCEGPYEVFDGESSTYWITPAVTSALPKTMPFFIYKFDKSHTIYRIDADSENCTNGSSTETLEIYVSEKETGEDSWVKVGEDKYSYGRNTAGTPHNKTFEFDKPLKVRRIKVNSLVNCTSAGWWSSKMISEVRAYGL